VISDTSVKVKALGSKEGDVSKSYVFKVIPKIDQGHVFESVINRLTTGNSIGIFPEGGSHDRTDLLPIKAGVAIMALGALNKDPKTKLSIVACGLKYFKPNRFRSKVVVEFSRPLKVSRELALKYSQKETKREACGDLLEDVEKKMREVTLNASSYK